MQQGVYSIDHVDDGVASELPTILTRCLLLSLQVGEQALLLGVEVYVLRELHIYLFPHLVLGIGV